MKQENYKKELASFHEKLMDIIELYGEKIPVYEYVNQLIITAVSMSSYFAPNPLIAIKAVLASVERRIESKEAMESEKKD
jgi:hypothetical protein